MVEKFVYLFHEGTGNMKGIARLSHGPQNLGCRFCTMVFQGYGHDGARFDRKLPCIRLIPDPRRFSLLGEEADCHLNRLVFRVCKEDTRTPPPSERQISDYIAFRP